MFKASNTGKIFATAVATDLITNKGKGTTSIAPGCAILSIILLGLFTSPFIWLYFKIFG